MLLHLLPEETQIPQNPALFLSKRYLINLEGKNCITHVMTNGIRTSTLTLADFNELTNMLTCSSCHNSSTYALTNFLKFLAVFRRFLSWTGLVQRNLLLLRFCFCINKKQEKNNKSEFKKTDRCKD